MSTEKRYIIACSYWSKRQPNVGRDAFFDDLVPALEAATGFKPVGIAPYHRRYPGFPARLITTIKPKLRDIPIPIDMVQDREDPRGFYLLPRDEHVCALLGQPPFFNTAPDDPHGVSGRGEAQDAQLLLRDVLLFASAVRLAVRLLVADIPCIWLLHEWHGAACILAHPRSGRDRFQVLLSSSYDSGPVIPALLHDFGIDPNTCPAPGMTPTILERALRILPPGETTQGYEQANQGAENA